MDLATAVRRPARSEQPAARWWILALIALAPSVLAVGTLLVEALSDGLVGAVPAARLLQLTFNTLVLAGAVNAAATAIGVVTAWLTTRTDLPGRRIASILVAIPLVIPSYVVALTLLGATGPSGVLSELMSRLGSGPVPQLTGFWGAWLALTVISVPFVHVAVVPAIRKLDPALEEAARGLGASRLRVFFTVTVPLLRPALAASGLLVSLYTVSDFGAVSLLRFDTFTRAIYAQYQGRIDRRPALTLALFLIVIALAIVWFERRTRSRAAYHSVRAPRRPERIHLRAPAAAAAWLLVGAVSMVSLVIPTGVLVSWLIRGVTSGAVVFAPWLEAARSIGVSAGAAAVAALAALPIAYVTVRGSGRGAAAIETGVWSTYALPHITFGLAMVTLALTLANPLYQTVALLVIAYASMFLPQTVGSAQDSLRRVPPSLEEASRSLGKSPSVTFARVTLPLVGRGLLAGSVLVFLTAMKELPATLLLRPTGFETLAIRVWAATGEGFYTRASAAALVLLGVSAVPLALVTIRGLHD